MARAIESWFERAARPLPWRISPRDPYLSLVSEFMLQQTQVARVLEKFGPFIERFPTVRELAGAREQQVLSLWSGLGYYRRARLLHAAARSIVAEHAGVVPRDVPTLRTLPGVGRYTAGAIASIVHGLAEPIVDGNVSRVLLRVHGRDGASDDPAAVAWAWERAEAMARAARSPALVNEGLMELGAVICTPRAPRCAECPLAALCIARRDGRQDEIPRPKAAARRRTLAIETVLLRDPRGRVLVQRRPARGMWASMWQAPTLERQGPAWSRAEARRRLEAWLGVGGLRVVDQFDHGTSHRDVRVRVWHGATIAEPGAFTHRCPGLVWKSPAAAARLGISNLQRRVLLHVEPSLPVS